MSEQQVIARSELILGGQRSGKSRRAEMLARNWLSQSPGHKAVFVATAQAWDDEMRERIARHKLDRAERVPAMLTIEEPLNPGDALTRQTDAHTIVVIDCLTLWLTNLMMPPESAPEGSDSLKKEEKMAGAAEIWTHVATLLIAIKSAPGPVVLVGNEIGLGVIPMGRETRAFVDELGRLNQEVAAACARVTFMAAGLPLALKAP